MIKNVFPYLVMNGNGREAVWFYEQAIGAQVIEMTTFGDLPENEESHFPEEAKDRIMNAQLQIGSNMLMISDTFPGEDYRTGEQVTIAITMDDVAQSKEIFEKLQEGGEVLMELQQTFWSPSYGQVKDKFHVTWQVSAEPEESK